MFDIEIKSNLDQIQRKLNSFANRQVPFATAQALSAVADIVAEEERKNLERVLDRPTPFTLRSVGVQRARKDRLYAVVYVKDVAAAYLYPYEFGGLNKLNSRALLKPVDARLNQYGNLPKSALNRYKNRRDVFIGKVKTKIGDVNGVWQRIQPAKGKPGGLKLLVRFADAHEATQHLGWRTLAKRVVMQNLKKEFGKAMAKAIATAR